MSLELEDLAETDCCHSLEKPWLFQPSLLGLPSQQRGKIL